MTTYIGIDPGQKGGIAMLNDHWEPRASCHPMPLSADKEIDVVAIHQLIAEWPSPRRVAIEKVASMPKQGVASVFTFGKGYGRVLGMLEVVGYSYELVRPQVWKAALGVTADKGKAIATAKRMFPELAGTIGNHDGMAEALLIAIWRLRHGG